MTTTTPTSADQNSLREIMREFISACHDAGLSANVIEPPAGDRPQVRVQAPDTPGFMADVVTLAEDATGTLWWWYSWGRMIGPAGTEDPTDLETVVKALAHVVSARV